MTKSILEEVVVGGLTALALIIGYNIYLSAHVKGIEAGDWLQFSGALLGTFLAVIGALYVERRRREHEKERGKATLVDVFKQIESELDGFLEPLTGDLNKDVGAINARRFFLESARGYADFVVKQHLAPEGKSWRTIFGMIGYIDRVMAVTWYEHDPAIGEDNCTDETVAHWHKRVTKIVTSAKPLLEKVIAREATEPS